MTGLEVDNVLHRARVIPVVTLSDVAEAVPLAQALLNGGIGTIEITLRSESALDGIAAIRREVPLMLVGAGTVWTPHQWRQCEAAGAQFVVSPGAPAALLQSAPSRALPYLPGAQTPTEVAALVSAGFKAVKFFPAESAGGIPALRALSAVFDGLQFCPTGGINPQTARDYLALESVPCVGGSWLAQSDLVRDKRWHDITAMAREFA